MSTYADALADSFTVHLWDMPGYGASSKEPDHAVDFRAQAQTFRALLDHWRLDEPHVVAHDFGGAVSLRTTLVEQARFASLLLVDVVAIPPSGSQFFRFVQDHPDVLHELPDYVHEAILRTYVQGASHRGLRDEDLDELVAPWLTAAGKPAFYRQIAQYDEQYLVENERLLADLRCRAAVLWGRDDSWIPVETGRRLASLLPDAGFTEVPGSGHLMQYDAPVALADALRSWLSA